jgi:excisionase family DNA binding protein
MTKEYREWSNDGCRGADVVYPKVLGVSRSQVYVLMKGGQLGSVHIGRSRRIAKEHVLQFINNLMEV